jgi:hypothetical protein
MIQRYVVATQNDPYCTYGVLDPTPNGSFVSVDDVAEVINALLALIQLKLDPFLLTDDEETMLKATALEWSV